MKPLKLEMTAFASYGGKQEIDFTKLKDGIFLITGKTGAGKTAIFDAMMYAMYGQSTGARDAKDLRSHFADPGTNTEVAFTFSHNGKIYRAERVIKVNKKTHELYSPTGNLYEDGEITQNNISGISNRITEILGLTAAQFKNVIMLAQGEFKQFLTSETKDKAQLLSQIFDNSVYKNFQDALICAKDILEAERKEEYEKINGQIEHYFSDNGYDIVLLSDDEDLLEKAEAIIEKDNSSLEILSSNSKDEQKAYDRILTEKANAQRLNNDIDTYNSSLIEYNELAAKKSVFDKKQDELDRAEKFLRNIKPLYTEFNNSEDQFKEAKSKYDENKRLTEEVRGSLAKAQKDAEAIPKINGEIEGLKAQIEIAKASLGKYKDLDKKTAELNEAKRLEAEKTSQLNAVLSELNDKKTALEDQQKRLDELKNADVLELEAQNECNKARDALDAVNKAARSAAEIFEGEKAIAEAKNKIRQAELDHDEKLAAYGILNRNFISAKYGIIADEIRVKLETQEHADCPVCGSAVTRADECRFAPVPENTPTQEQVDDAYNLAQAAKEKIAEEQHNLKDIEKDYKHQKHNVLNLIQPYIPEFTDWGKLTEDGKLKAKLGEFRENETAAARRLEKAVSDKENRDALLKMKESAEPQIKALEDQIQNYKTELNLISGKIIGLNAAIEALKKDLQFSSLQEASVDIKQKWDQINELNKKSETLKSAETAAQNRLSSLNGESNALEENYIKASDKFEKDEILLNNALEKFDYDSIEHALSDITFIETEPEEWIKERRDEIANYKERLSSCKNIERKLFKNLAGQGEKIPEKADLEEISLRLDEQKERLENATNAEVTLLNLIEVRKDAFGKIKNSEDKLSKTEETYQRIKRLAVTAEGKIGDKYPFDRFMLSKIFEEILNAANVRLNTMSAGRYELSPSVKGNLGRNKQLGFEIEVMDMNTGQRRNPKSLSGGETFLTSLSLALGLSDVISRKTGGNKVEAMFIDEGFGSLDPSALDTALSVLMSLTGADYQIGIISHVDKLKESIPQKIRVTQDKNGSVAEIE